LDDDLKVVLSKRLRSYFPQPVLEQNFVQFAGKFIQLPEKVAEPDKGFSGTIASSMGLVRFSGTLKRFFSPAMLRRYAVLVGQP